MAFSVSRNKEHEASFYSVLADESSYRDLKSVLSKVLESCAPLEVCNLDQIRNGLLRFHVPSKAQEPDASKSVRTRGFPGAIEAGVLSLHLVSGTLALIEIYRNKKHRDRERELEYSLSREWQGALVEAGMDPELARQIPLQFAPDMIRFIATQRVASASKPKS